MPASPPSSPRKQLATFFCRFIILYIILAIPWPGWHRACGAYIRAVGSLVFATDDERREIAFESPGEASSHSAGTHIVIVNKAFIHPDGSGPVRNVDLDFGWPSIALVLALILATPIPWARRRWALLWGLLSIHVLFLLSLGLCIWTESAEISLTNPSPFVKSIALALREAMQGQFNLAAPILIWLLVTFRREDARTFLGQFIPPSEGESPSRV